jgi:arabinose-5-phosphate isomerase
MVKIMRTQMTEKILVKDVMIGMDKVPVVFPDTFLKKVLEDMGSYRLGIACVVDNSNKLLGIITDGDIRRKLISVQKPFSAFFVDDAIDHAIKNPATSTPTDTLSSAVQTMKKLQVWDLPVIDDHGVLIGLLHLHPAVEALLKAIGSETK